MGKTIIALVVALAFLVPAGALADGMPPGADKSAPKGGAAATGKASRVSMSDLKSDAPDSYTVVKGDTLWGIAGRFLKEPWRWPEIWDMNKDRIKDPHWIYPGDVIRLDKSGEYPSLSLASGGGAAEAEANVVKLDPRVRVETLRVAIPSIPASAIGPFLSQPLVVEAGGLDTAPMIVANDDSRVMVGAGDVTYADPISGDIINWQVFRPGTALRDPETGEILGFEAKYVGDAKVSRFGRPTKLQVVKAREEVTRGDRLMPAREVVLPSYVPHAPDKPIKGVIMSVEGGVSEFGQFSIITINRGSRDGMEVGHVLASSRRGTAVAVPGAGMTNGYTVGPLHTWFNHWGFGPPQTASPPPDPAATAPLILPDERNGLIFVFRVFEKMSYAMVMHANKPIFVGDVVSTP